MHEYDVAFKLTLQQVDVAIRELTGTTIAKWHNVELPEVRNTRVDLLGETAGGDLVHRNSQSANEPGMALRMAEYCLRVYRIFGRFPLQVLIYVGDPPVSMETQLTGPGLQFRYRLVDIRDLDAERLLASAHVGDNIIAVLTKLRDARSSVDRILARISTLEPGEREATLARLLILAGLRGLSQVVEEEARKMPILNDILDHPVLGREYKRGVRDGEQNGLQKGLQTGQRRVVESLLTQRFGPLPPWVRERLESAASDELEAISLRILDANSIEQVFSKAN